MDFVFAENINIERLLPAAMTFKSLDGEPRYDPDRIVDFKTAMTPVRTKCLFMLTYATLQTICQQPPQGVRDTQALGQRTRCAERAELPVLQN
jgi:hypothetical protein